MGANGRVGLTIVGQVVGAYFGPIGSMVGGMIGSAIGSAIWPEQFEGPKLEGLQVSGSAYGGPIPSVYGAARLGGNVIWASPIRETARTERQGKGGGPEITSYTYSLDFALGMCEGPVVGFRRVWADQKLIFDAGTDDIGTIFASFQQGGIGMRFYPGNTTQLPDPTIEAALGVGATPAFRDLCYIVFNDFQLAEFGNRVPNITVEVITGGTAGGPRQLINILHGIPTIATSDLRLVADGAQLFYIAEASARQTYLTELNGSNARPVSYGATGGWPVNKFYFSAYGESLTFWPYSGLPIYTLNAPATNSGAQRALFDVAEVAGVTPTDVIRGRQFAAILANGGRYTYALIPSADREHLLGIYAEADAGESPTSWVLWRYQDPVGFAAVRSGTVDAGALLFRAYGSADSRVGPGNYYAAMLESDLVNIWCAETAGTFRVTLNAIGGDNVIRSVSTFNMGSPDPTAFETIAVYADYGCCWVRAAQKLHAYTRSPALTLSTTLDVLVSNLCLQAGLQAGDIDVTSLASTVVRGYIRSTRMTARAAIEPLMTAYGFDAVESDQKIKFVLRAAVPVATIPDADLGASAGDSDSSVVPVLTERGQESELPVAIEVSYLATEADYQIGTQTIRRQITDSIDRQSIRLPLGLQAQDAASIAARMIYELWTARNQRRWATTVKWARCEPTDVVDIVTSAATYRVRIADKREDGNTIQWAGVDVDAAAFAATATGAPIPGGGTVVKPPGLTLAYVADLPPLLERDFGSTGYYAAAASYTSPWPGAVLYRQPEGSSTSDLELQFDVAATLGGAITALGAWGDAIEGKQTYRGLYPDLINTVDVSIASGTLSSCTHDEFLALKNVAVIGNEIIAFRDAVSLGGGVYRLSCLLRGLQGTEWYAALPPATNDAVYVIFPDGQAALNDVATVDGHRVSDGFLLLEADKIKRYQPTSVSARIAGKVKSVTAGASPEFGSNYTLAQTWASIVAPAPTQVQAYKSATNMLVVNFAPRSYVGGQWLSGREITLDASHSQFAICVNSIAVPAIKDTFIVNGSPPFEISLAALVALGGAGQYGVSVAATPKLFPDKGALGIISSPDIAPRHWSRQRIVNW